MATQSALIAVCCVTVFGRSNSQIPAKSIRFCEEVEAENARLLATTSRIGKVLEDVLSQSLYPNIESPWDFSLFYSPPCARGDSERVSSVGSLWR